MTTTIIETVSSTTSTITFTDVWDRDLLIVGVKLFDDGTLLASVEHPPDWEDYFYTGTENGFWVMPFHADELSYTFDVQHASAMQFLGLHLRSDLTTGPNAFNTRTSEWGTPAVTVGSADALIGWTIVRDGSIDLTTPGFVLIDQTSHIAVWRHDPLQVPVGTSFMADSYFNTVAYISAWREWAGGAPPVPAAVGGWNVWIVD